MLVAGLAADPKLFAQIRDAKASALGEDDETIDLFHGREVLPGHSAQDCYLSPRIKCHLSPRFIPAEGAEEADAVTEPATARRSPLGSLARFANPKPQSLTLSQGPSLGHETVKNHDMTAFGSLRRRRV